ncbi:MAG: ribosome silencing factor [Bacteroidales bacterium]
MAQKTNNESTSSGASALCQAIADGMLDKKAQNVQSLNLTNIDGAICSYFVICNADSTTQVDAIARNVEEHVRKTLGEKPRRSQGFENSIWVILDYIDVMVHIFETETRAFYNIEKLWADAPTQHYTDEPPMVKSVKKKPVATKKVSPVKKKTTAKEK